MTGTDTGTDQRVRPLGYQPSLDGLRAIAVVAVVVYHLHQSSAPGGWAGVQLFFVLSGFLITSLLLSESSTTGGVSVGRFWMRRVLRLLPALVVMLVGYTVMVALTSGGSSGHDALVQSLRALTYGYNWFSVADGAWDELAHLWSLSVEEQFYVVWPLVMVVVLHGRRRGATASPGTRRLVALTVIGIVASAWWQWHLLADGHTIRAVAGTDSTAYAILAGCLLAEIRSLRLPGAQLLERIRPAAAPVGVAAFLAIVLFVHDAGHTTRLAVPVASLLMIIGLVDVKRGPVARAFSSPPLRAVGRVSYGLYLWHIPAILLCGRVVREAGVASELKYPLAIVAMTAATIVSYRFVEQPFLRMKHRFEAPATQTLE